MKLVTSKANPIWHFRHQMRGPRRIVHVPQQFASRDWSGTEAIVLELAKQQAGTGMDPVIISTLELSEIRHEIIDGIRVHRHPHSYLFFGSGDGGVRAQQAPAENLLSVPVFQSLMQEPEVRLFHAHTLGRLGGEVRNAARMRARPFVISAHHGLFGEGPEESAPPQPANEAAGANGFTVVSGSGQELADADMVIFSDKAEAERALATLGHDRIAFLPHGIDGGRFANGHGIAFRAIHGIPRKAFLVGGFGRPDAETNLLLLDALAQASPRRDAVHLVLVEPEGQSEYAYWIAEAAQQRCVEGRVHLVSASESQEALANAFHACDALVALSSRESSKSDLLGAWSTGKAVIAANNNGLESLARDDGNALFFSPEATDTVAQITARIDRLASDEALCHRLGNEGRTQAQPHDWHRIGARLEEIYQLAEGHHQYARQQGRKAA